MKSSTNFLKKISIVGMFSFSAIFAYASYVLNKGGDDIGIASLIGPAVAEGADCDPYTGGTLIGTGSGSASGTGSGSGSGSGSSSQGA